MRVFWATLTFWAAFGARLLSSIATVAPDRDTAWYIHMAKQAREGGFAWLQSVFPPLHPWLLSLLGPVSGTQPEDWWLSAQLLCSFEGALATALLYWVFSRRFGWRLASLAALSLGFNSVSCGTAADGMTEPLFQLFLVLGIGVWLWNQRAWFFPSLFLGFLPLIRPEGLILLPWAWWLSGRRSKALILPSLLLSLGPRMIYLYLRFQVTGDLSLFPKGAFMRHLSVFSEESLIQGLQHWGREASQFFGQGFEGMGFLIWPLFLFGGGWLWTRKNGWTRPFRILYILLLLGLLIVPLYHANRRFHTTWLPLALCLGLIPFIRATTRIQNFLLLLGLAALVPSVVRIMKVRRASLIQDRALGVALRKKLPKKAGIASDLPRLLFFSGRSPLPPRHILAQDLRKLAARKKTVAVVSLKKRKKLNPGFLRGLGYREVSLSHILEKKNRIENKRGLQLFMRETVMVK